MREEVFPRAVIARAVFEGITAHQSMHQYRRPEPHASTPLEKVESLHDQISQHTCPCPPMAADSAVDHAAVLDPDLTVPLSVFQESVHPTALPGTDRTSH